MLNINPIRTDFKSRPIFLQSKPEKQSGNPIIENKSAAALTGLSALALAIVGIKKCSVTSVEKALSKRGVELKSGIAYVKETGKKFTGSVKRQSKAFGRENETRTYVDGKLTEELRYDWKNREVSANIYRDGMLFREAFLSMRRGAGKVIVYREYGNGTGYYNGQIVKSQPTKKGSLPRKGAFEVLRKKGEVPGPDERFILF